MKSLRVILNVVLMASIVLIGCITIPQILGYKLIVIETGSMEPTLKVGSVCLVKPEDRISKGNIITFCVNPEKGTLVTHRVVEVQSDGKYRTMGDNNNVVDAVAVELEAIEGVTKLNVPYIGVLVKYLSEIEGKIVIISLLGMLLAASEMAERVLISRKWNKIMIAST